MRINTSYAKQTLANLEEAGLQHYDLNAPPPYEVPADFRTFFQEFGGLEHDGKRDPKTNRPLVVKDLAPYQYEFAELNYGFMLKCNKVGMTTSEMLRDFHYLLMPENAGFDILLQAAKIELANELLLNLKIKIEGVPGQDRSSWFYRMSVALGLTEDILWSGHHVTPVLGTVLYLYFEVE